MLARLLRLHPSTYKRLVVCWACSAAWGCKSPAQPDGGEGLVITQGLPPRGGV
jgi:hypothetical protein